MKTLSPTQARQNLTGLLDRAVNGEDVGIIHTGSGRIVGLRVVEVISRPVPFSADEVQQAFANNDEADTFPAHATKQARPRRPSFE